MRITQSLATTLFDIMFIAVMIIIAIVVVTIVTFDNNVGKIYKSIITERPKFVYSGDFADKIKQLGYNDPKDIEIFLKRIGANYYDFLRSKSLRKQYEIFSEGKSTDFIAEATAHKKTTDASRRGLVTGAAVGVIIGNAISK